MCPHVLVVLNIKDIRHGPFLKLPAGPLASQST